MIQRMRALYPHADPTHDYEIRNDGHGDYLAGWNMAGPPPEGVHLQMASTRDFITNYRAQVSRLIEVFEATAGDKAEWDALDLGNVLTEEDFQGTGITKDRFVAAIVSIEALRSVFAQGHNTNLYRVRE